MFKRVIPTALLLATSSMCAQADNTTAHGFLEDSKASLSLRTLYFNSDNRDGTAAPSKTEEAAQGFLLRYESGFTQGTLGFGLDAQALLGITLDSGHGRHLGSGMIPTDGDDAANSWSSFGPTAKMRISKTEFRYGTLLPKLPILLSNDARLLPQSFTGAQVTSNEINGLMLTGGVLEHAVGRASTDRTGLSVPGGTQDSNKFYFAGGDYNITKDLKAQYYFAQLEDFYNQNFFGLTHVLPIDGESSFTTDLRYFRTTSTGANSSAAGRSQGYQTSGYTKDNNGEIDNSTWVGMVTYFNSGHAVSLGHQHVGAGSNFTQPNQGGLVDKGAGGGSVYLPTDRMIQNFGRAGEQTNFGQYSYDFAPLGVPGLRATIVYLKGTDIKAQNAGDQSEWERDMTVDYVLQSGSLKGLAFSLRNGKSNTEAGRNVEQNRFIINYTLSLL
ncbi:OprD family porin [Pseudomonas sp. 10B1]|uniref:OprD family porin n=1 Tax=unclassified Pseudomonas TaxID=196821 RepID=UPI002AB3809F|nr:MULTISPECIES: OprD family porin [unclassified Pseudomonas]MDY7560464.1 OprD family porin [Pseudomonas sp. AB6]MEA9975942.1 OprD family porin [Pseudomonas sp. RTS4]MEA9993221.1 OprD family porin [Pseudomonas sp. AA4]MEB0088045.1 OprD family porin [Pseudomonas sp. RTI1]MEB0124292.1 OprD family porin [Pseudomonas sp. CCC1.2]